MPAEPRPTLPSRLRAGPPVVDTTHAAAAAAARRLEQERKADGLRHSFDLGFRGDDVGAVTDGDREAAGDGAGRRLVSAPAHRIRAGSDERDTRLDAGLRELGALRDEPVAGVERVAARALGGCDQAADVEVALGRARGPDADDAVGELRGEAPTVGVRHDEHRLEPLVEAGAQDPDGDLATVGDQDTRDAAQLRLNRRDRWR